jgi:hypothetical protein
MSELKVKKVSDRAGTGAPDFTYGLNVSGVDSGISPFTHTESATEPSSPSNGDTWWDSDNEIYYVYINDEWTSWIGTPASSAVWYGDRSIAVGGKTGSSGTELNTIEYFSISALSGTASDFGDLTRTSSRIAACSDATYGVFMGGQYYTSAWNYVNTIDYITIATTGNASDFGDLTVGRSGGAAVSDGTYGCCFGGSTGSYVNTIDYVTIASPGNASDFGDLTESPTVCAGSNDATRGLRGGGYTTTGSDVIDYFTIASPGNATDFGDLTVAGYYLCGFGDGTYGVFGAFSGSDTNVTNYVTIQTTGNATAGGDLSDTLYARAGSSDGTYGVFAGGATTANDIEYVTIATASAASDFGTLATARFELTGTSGAAS